MNQKQVFTELYESYSPGILKLCMGYTGDRNQAEDLLQEVFFSVWNNMQKFRQDAAWSTWIYRIAVNTCLTYLRKKKLITVDLDADFLGAMPEEKSAKEQEIQLLYTCISKLAEADRLIIGMVLDDKPYDEIATILGLTVNNLRVKIHRIKKQLTEIYNSYARL
ncbi:RNA polymerase sigma factor [Flavihumibacter sp. UBA7668]|uniref:RNA polymerase sigma factor n=1 Tax=Flavihumibacter sp. UBA7668 TaxID=1946542 RepID=UPI0025C02FE1|nr:sigma-70 family RNA polymerase sigma factor [Flavihumibacter sp. UBA7668]